MEGGQKSLPLELWQTLHDVIIIIIVVTLQKMYLIMELCKGGELSLKLREKSYFKEEVTVCIATVQP